MITLWIAEAHYRREAALMKYARSRWPWRNRVLRIRLWWIKRKYALERQN